MKGGGKWGERGREVGIGYPPVHPLTFQTEGVHNSSYIYIFLYYYYYFFILYSITYQRTAIYLFFFFIYLFIYLIYLFIHHVFLRLFCSNLNNLQFV